MTRCYLALGVDPAPGDPDGVDAVARTCRAAAASLGESAVRLRGLAAAGGWGGAAADSARERLRSLAGRLDDAGAVLHRLGGDLGAWANALRDAQARAWRLERAARGALAALPDEAAAAELEVLRRQAGRLRVEVAADAERAARALRQAAADAPGPTWREQVRTELDRWVLDDVRAVGRLARGEEREVGMAAKGAGAATLLVGGPVGVALAGVSLGATGLLAARGQAAPLDVALAGAGVATGGLATGAVRLADGARRSAPAWRAVGGQSDAAGKGMTTGGLVPLLPGVTPTPSGRSRSAPTPTPGLPPRALLGPVPAGPLLLGPPPGEVPGLHPAPDDGDARLEVSARSEREPLGPPST